MSTLSRISTTAIVLHQNDQGETLRSTKLPAFYQHRMPDADMNLVAELKVLTTGEKIEYRSYRGSTYRPVPERAKEASGGCVYLRLPEQQADEVVRNYNQRSNPAHHDTLAYQGVLWVKTTMPTYRISTTETSVDVIASSDPTNTTAFNGLQQADAVVQALNLGEELGLPMHQTHQILIHELSLAGPAAKTREASALHNTVQQRLEAIASATQQVEESMTERDITWHLEHLIQLVNRLDEDTVHLRLSA